MPHYGILRDHKFEGIDDLRGSEVYGVNDEKLGTIDDVIFDHSSGDIRYIVLKTVGLLSHKKVMIPANRIDTYGNHDDKFYAELDKERVEMLPEFNHETLKTESDWATFEKDYEKRWTDGAVLYNKDTGRIITPAHNEAEGLNPVRRGSSTPASGSKPDLKLEKMGKEDDFLGISSGTNATTRHPQKPSIGGREDVELMQRERASREVMNPIGEEIEIPGEAGVSGSMSDSGIYQGRRWNVFQEMLRSRRDKIVVDCPHCASQDKAA
jgi:sporulation protein YlmC with PRC-barrel domain